MENEFEFSARLNAFKLSNQGTIITAKHTLQSKIPGEVQTFLDELESVVSIDKLSHLFNCPVPWKDLKIPVGRRVDLDIEGLSYLGEMNILEEIKVVRTETEAGALFIYTFSFTKEFDREDEHLAHSLNQKDNSGEFICHDIKLTLNKTDIASTMGGE